MRDRLNQCDIGVQNILQNVFSIAGSSNTQYLERRTLGFDLASKFLEHFDRVLNRIAVRKLVGFAENLTFLVEHNRLGRS